LATAKVWRKRRRLCCARKSYPEPCALRALGIVREDEELIERPGSVSRAFPATFGCRLDAWGRAG
jgi:hypothetical protein